MAYAPQESLKIQYGIAEQSTFNTAVADNAAFVELDCEQVDINIGLNQKDLPGNYGVNYPVQQNFVRCMSGSIATFTVKGIAKRAELGYWLYGFNQKVVEVASGVYKKTHTRFTTHPDYTTGSAFKIFTFIKKFPEAGKSWKLANCIIKKLTLEWKRNDFLEFSADFVSVGTVNTTSTPSGTWTKSPPFFMHMTDIDRATVAGTAVLIHDFTLELDQEISVDGPNGSGSYNAYAISGYKPTYKLNVLKDATVETALTTLKAGQIIDYRIGMGNATAGTSLGDLDFVFQGKADDIKPTHDNIIGAEFTGTCMAASSATRELTIITADGTNRSWPTT